MAKDKGKVEDKKKGNGKAIAVLLAIVLGIPMLVGTGLYFAVPAFKAIANDVLSYAPGPVGTFFESMPTEEEKDQKIKDIAEYMLNIDTKRAVDKLIILKKDDPTAYDRIVKSMVRINPNTTKAILETIRENSIKKDPVLNTLSQIEKERTEEYKKKADFLGKLSISTALEEMDKTLKSSVNGHKELAGIAMEMTPEVAGSILKYLAKDDFNKVLQYMPLDDANAIKTSISTYKGRISELTNAADLYASEDNAKLVEVIGSTKTYSMQELAVIYKALGPLKAGQVLAQAKDDQFTFELLNNMKENEVLEVGIDNLTKDVVKALKVYKEFDDNVSELATIYEKLDTVKVATNLNQMLKNSAQPRVYALGSGESIVITDENLALEIIRKVSPKKKGEILQNLDEFTATELTRKLAIPK